MFRHYLSGAHMDIFFEGKSGNILPSQISHYYNKALTVAEQRED